MSSLNSHFWSVSFCLPLWTFNSIQQVSVSVTASLIFSICISSGSFDFFKLSYSVYSCFFWSRTACHCCEFDLSLQYNDDDFLLAFFIFQAVDNNNDNDSSLLVLWCGWASCNWWRISHNIFHVTIRMLLLVTKFCYTELKSSLSLLSLHPPKIGRLRVAAHCSHRVTGLFLVACICVCDHPWSKSILLLLDWLISTGNKVLSFDWVPSHEMTSFFLLSASKPCLHEI